MRHPTRVSQFLAIKQDSGRSNATARAVRTPVRRSHPAHLIFTSFGTLGLLDDLFYGKTKNGQDVPTVGLDWNCASAVSQARASGG